MDTLYIIVPCYNEEDALPESARVLRQKLITLIGSGRVSPRSRVLMVDDGSSDTTWYLITRLSEANENLCGIRLRKNRGHQNALMAGLVYAMDFADVTVTIDADLQDDVDAIDKMIDKYLAGAQIVCGVRSARSSDSFLKRTTAELYYALLSLAGCRQISNHADFRLLSREAVRRLCCFGTEDLYLRGLVTRLDLPVEKVMYERIPRIAGESKYDLKRMLHLARRGFASRKLRPADEPQYGELWIGQVVE